MSYPDNITEKKSKLCDCYELACRIEQMAAAGMILEERLERIRDYPNDTETSPAGKMSACVILSNAIRELSQSNGATQAGPAWALQRVASLPESAEKEYVLALLALKKGRNETQRVQAMRHVINGLGLSPNDPRLTALANILQEAG